MAKINLSPFPLIGAAFILFHPEAVATLFHVDMTLKYYFFSLGLVVYSLVIFSQKVRLGKAER